MLAAKLSIKDEEFLKIVLLLLRQKGIDAKSKDFHGWALIDEAVSTLNTRLLGIVFEYFI
jgi:hypothetical protein